MKTYLIAGHKQGGGEGAQNLNTKETENMITRVLLPQVQEVIDSELCPINTSLGQKISWINARAGQEDFNLSCHLNSSGGRQEKGAMCYYYGGSEASKQMAIKFLKAYCDATGIKNTGVRPDTSSRFGRLGVVRDTIGWTILLELGSINNDLETVKEKGVAGMIAGLRSVLDIEDPEDPKNMLTEWQVESWGKALNKGIATENSIPTEGLTKADFFVYMDRIGLLD